MKAALAELVALIAVLVETVLTHKDALRSLNRRSTRQTVAIARLHRRLLRLERRLPN